MDRLFEITINIYTIIIALNVNLLVDLIKPYLINKEGRGMKLIYPIIFLVSIAEVFSMKYLLHVDVPTDPAQWLTVAIVSVVLYDIGGYAKIKKAAGYVFDAAIARITSIVGTAKDK